MPSRAHRDYQKGFAGKIGWGQRPALLLVDVCNAYWSDASPLDTKSNPASAAAPASIAKLVAAARQGKVPLIWTRVEYTEPDMSDAGLFYSKVPLLKLFQTGCGNGLEKWIPGLEPAAGEVVVCKRYPSAFFATDLATQLQLFNVDTVIICGVVEEACGDKSPAVHDANIADINAKMADVVFEDEAIEKLEAGWQ
ncbi:hypothetical protein AA0113_g304 [Alternaria arborescens]|uniref:Isochorismatase-like domain-containing protein n=2 Tax=Alternaria sect. Alternaria TaxID=2499237 RepID=A0A4Q4SSK2_9PLEO|nr:hypothetical protein AA0111_g7560 [Alternaria arborescens]KAB2105418.1 hypothetical protein AG0111_0g6318 [Alternaria gaisen]RYN40288.1 hypothetical protein AA0112_g3166 [Alternaria arborescens]RYO27181.1 hypothetical protein AA0111_g7560 [Alternaria arborescens]RYO73289.1 hypothetical protein AA0113_g304 [Alternaria arborescens]